jgi:hypothetical protein
MGASAVDEWDLNQINLAQVNNSESSFNGAMNDAADSAHFEDEVSEEIGRYFQELLDRNKQRLSLSKSDTSGARQPTCKQPSTRVTFCLEPSTPEPLRDENSSPTQPGVTDSVGFRTNTAACGPVARPSPPHNPDCVSAGHETLPDAVRHAPKCDIATMREVAHSSARNAIARHDAKQIWQRAHIYLSLTAMAMCISAMLYSIAPHYVSPSSLVATSILTLGLVSACRSHLLLRRARHRLSHCAPDVQNKHSSQNEGRIGRGEDFTRQEAGPMLAGQPHRA